MSTLTLILLIIWTPLLIAYGISTFKKYRNKHKVKISKDKNQKLWQSLLQ